MNLSLLIHTFDQYRKYWDGWVDGYCRNGVNYSGGDYLIFWGTDIEPPKEQKTIGNVLLSGKGEWSDRLIKLVHQIPTDFIFYCQEDMWPCAKHPDLTPLMEFIIKNDIYRLQISPVVQFYSLYGSNIPLFFHYKSKYLVSHQPSIWRKDFLLKCLAPNEDPWKNEYEGTKRLNHPEITGKIAIYPHNWFTHESVKIV